jgi:hypothetical protein
MPDPIPESVVDELIVALDGVQTASIELDP